MRVTLALPILLSLAAPLAAESPAPPPAPARPTATDTYTEVTRSVAVLQPSHGSAVQGTVWFEKVADGVRVTAHVSGLQPGTHGFHIHEYGDCSALDATSAGGHFNPKGEPHGAPADERHHTGDLGNLEAKADGTATLEITSRDLPLSGERTVVGRGVVVHARRDDLKTQPSGDAGDRLACGTIGIAKPAAAPAK
jgi:superoxide dismutase, Cu-Zn family